MTAVHDAAHAARTRRGISAVALAALALGSCVGPSRFALRPALTREPAPRLFERAPRDRSLPTLTDSIDSTTFRTTTRYLAFEPPHEATDVNALDEVPDSTWYTNRAPTPEETARGPCTDTGPVAPFQIARSKADGATPGLLVTDARGVRYVLKFEQHPRAQPEINSAADAVVSRLFWALGYNTPCNTVAYLRPEQLVVTPRSVHMDTLGRRRPLTEALLRALLRAQAPRPDGTVRASFSEFIEGEPIGPFPPEGVRPDDPNDTIAHEDRRELRGARLASAWVHHWDARDDNSLDSFVRPGGGRAGYVRHYFIDFGDSLGAYTTDAGDELSRRLGHTTVVNPGAMLADLAGLGIVRRPWESERVDPRAPDLGYFDVAHFDPPRWTQETPLLPFDSAQPEDLAWMARKIARVTPAHVRAVLPSAQLSSAYERERLLAVLLGRRERLLRWSFARVSPLADVRVAPGELLCATDLGLETGVSTEAGVAYATAARTGADLRPTARPPAVTRGATAAELCAALPAHFAPAGAPDDAPARYATVDLARVEGGAHTLLRAHLYDLGPARGYVLVGIER